MPLRLVTERDPVGLFIGLDNGRLRSTNFVLASLLFIVINLWLEFLRSSACLAALHRHGQERARGRQRHLFVLARRVLDREQARPQ